MREQESNENIELVTGLSKGKAAVTGETVDNEQPPHEVLVFVQPYVPIG
jgi:hypothetical protein